MILIALAMLSTAQQKPDINGSWQSPFLEVLRGIKVRQGATITPTNLDLTLEAHMDVPFFSPLITQTVISFDYAVGAASQVVANSWDFDMTAKTKKVAPMSDATRDNWNEEKECGFNDWSTGQFKDVTGIPCESDESTIEAGLKVYSLVSVKNSNTLMFGDEHTQKPNCDGTTPARRFCALHTLLPMDKQ